VKGREKRGKGGEEVTSDVWRMPVCERRDVPDLSFTFAPASPSLHRVPGFRDGHGCACIRIPAARRHSNLRLLSLSLASCEEAVRGARLVPRELGAFAGEENIFIRIIRRSERAGTGRAARASKGAEFDIRGRLACNDRRNYADRRKAKGQRPRCKKSQVPRSFSFLLRRFLDRATRTASR
jgi:hypothetical protein